MSDVSPEAATYRLLEEEVRKHLVNRVTESQIVSVVEELKGVADAAFAEGATPEQAWDRCVARVFEVRRRMIN